MIKRYFEEFGGRVTAGYTTDCGGSFHHNCEEDFKNYEFVAGQLGTKAEYMIRIIQKHTDNILTVTTENAGDGVIRRGTGDHYDGMITNTPGIMPCVITADCVPVFLYDEALGAAGLIHSGRAGTIKNIAGKAVRRMREEFGCDAKNIHAVLGPCICKDHHEVNVCDVEGFSEHFTKEEQAQFIEFRNEKAYVDMHAAIRIALKKEGLSDENITADDTCTFENTELYSWRREHNREKHIMSFIEINKK
ncbi:MAG: polyphenol oxidase family protein [Eubacteriales bacterium]|nr:polyphenol oxidase family protein [Eubacteriales bacterium]